MTKTARWMLYGMCAVAALLVIGRGIYDRAHRKPSDSPSDAELDEAGELVAKLRTAVQAAEADWHGADPAARFRATRSEAPCTAKIPDAYTVVQMRTDIADPVRAVAAKLDALAHSRDAGTLTRGELLELRALAAQGLGTAVVVVASETIAPHVHHVTRGTQFVRGFEIGGFTPAKLRGTAYLYSIDTHAVICVGQLDAASGGYQLRAPENASDEDLRHRAEASLQQSLDADVHAQLVAELRAVAR